MKNKAMKGKTLHATTKLSSSTQLPMHLTTTLKQLESQTEGQAHRIKRSRGALEWGDSELLERN
jgi:hypothetical protein